MYTYAEEVERVTKNFTYNPTWDTAIEYLADVETDDTFLLVKAYNIVAPLVKAACKTPTDGKYEHAFFEMIYFGYFGGYPEYIYDEPTTPEVLANIWDVEMADD